MDDREQDYRWLQRRADRVCALILNSACSDSQIRAERFILRRQAAWLFPNRQELYERIYESRFRRLLAQFRPPSRPTPPAATPESR